MRLKGFPEGEESLENLNQSKKNGDFFRVASTWRKQNIHLGFGRLSGRVPLIFGLAKNWISLVHIDASVQVTWFDFPPARQSTEPSMYLMGSPLPSWSQPTLLRHLLQRPWTNAAILRKKVIEVGVSKNSGTPESSILIGFSIINHPFWGTTIFGNTQVDFVQSFDGLNAVAQIRSCSSRYLMEQSGGHFHSTPHWQDVVMSYQTN